MSLIGHSGCGKSTVLNIVAGLYRATEGGVCLEGKEVCDPGPDRAVVFQNHSLMPWLTVYDNVALAVDQVFRKSKSQGRAQGVDRTQPAPGEHGSRDAQVARRNFRRHEAAGWHRPLPCHAAESTADG